VQSVPYNFVVYYTLTCIIVPARAEQLARIKQYNLYKKGIEELSCTEVSTVYGSTVVVATSNMIDLRYVCMYLSSAKLHSFAQTNLLVF